MKKIILLAIIVMGSFSNLNAEEVKRIIVGNKEAKMYDGSMAEWTADKGLPMQETAKIN